MKPVTTGTTPSATTPAAPPQQAKQGPLVVTPEVTPSKSGAPAVAVQRKQQVSKAPAQPKSTTPTATKSAAQKGASKRGAAAGQSNVALAPQLVAAQAALGDLDRQPGPPPRASERGRANTHGAEQSLATTRDG